MKFKTTTSFVDNEILLEMQRLIDDYLSFIFTQQDNIKKNRLKFFLIDCGDKSKYPYFVNNAIDKVSLPLSQYPNNNAFIRALFEIMFCYIPFGFGLEINDLGLFTKESKTSGMTFYKKHHFMFHFTFDNINSEIYSREEENHNEQTFFFTCWEYDFKKTIDESLLDYTFTISFFDPNNFTDSENFSTRKFFNYFHQAFLNKQIDFIKLYFQLHQEIEMFKKEATQKIKQKINESKGL